MSEPTIFDLTLTELPYTIGGTKYLLREANGEAACKYRNATLKAAKLGPDGKATSIDGLADAEPLLVSLCVFEVLPNGDTRPVPLVTVRQWPARIVRHLFDKAKAISGLGEKDEDSPKNAAPATTAGSS